MVVIFFAVWMGLDYVFDVFIHKQEYVPDWGLGLAASFIFGGMVLIQTTKRKG